MSRGAVRTTPAQARWALLVLFVVALVNYIDRSLLSILQVPIKAELGLSDSELGAITGLAFALVYATAGVPLAMLVDRTRRTWLMAAALAIWSLMTAGMSLAVGLLSLAVLRIGVALGESISGPATHSLLSDYFRPERRGTVLAVWVFAAPVGTMLGVFGGGWLSSSMGWRTAFMAIGLIGLILAPVLLLLREPVRGQQDDRAVETPGTTAAIPFRQALRTVLALPGFGLLLGAASFHGLGHTAMFNWAAPFYARVHHMPLAEVGFWVAIIIGVGGGAGTLMGGALVDRLAQRDRRWYGWGPAVAAILSVPLGLAQLFAPTAEMSIAIGFGYAFVSSFYLAPVFAIAQYLAPSTLRGMTSAVLMFVATIFGPGFGPFLAGVFSDLFLHDGMGDLSLRYALAVVLLGPAVASFLYVRLGTRLAEYAAARGVSRSAA